MDDRRCLLRGGVYDGRIWTGVIDVGQRAFCGGTDAWSMAGIYVVTALVDVDGDGAPVSVAVPAFAAVAADPAAGGCDPHLR